MDINPGAGGDRSRRFLGKGRKVHKITPVTKGKGSNNSHRPTLSNHDIDMMIDMCKITIILHIHCINFHINIIIHVFSHVVCGIGWESFGP